MLLNPVFNLPRCCLPRAPVRVVEACPFHSSAACVTACGLLKQNNHTPGLGANPASTASSNPKALYSGIGNQSTPAGWETGERGGGGGGGGRHLQDTHLQASPRSLHPRPRSPRSTRTDCLKDHPATLSHRSDQRETAQCIHYSRRPPGGALALQVTKAMNAMQIL